MSPKILLERRIQNGLKNVPDCFSEWSITHTAVVNDSCHIAFESYFDYSIYDSVEPIVPLCRASATWEPTIEDPFHWLRFSVP